MLYPVKLRASGSRGACAARTLVENLTVIPAPSLGYQRATDQFTKVLGFSGPQAEEVARRSSENIQAVTQASTVLARGVQEASQEVFGLVQDRLQKNVEALSRIAGTRSVQDFVAVQSDLGRRGVPSCSDNTDLLTQGGPALGRASKVFRSVPEVRRRGGPASRSCPLGPG